MDYDKMNRIVDKYADAREQEYQARVRGECAASWLVGFLCGVAFAFVLIGALAMGR